MLEEQLERYWQIVIVTWGWKDVEASKYILGVELIEIVGKLGLGDKERAIQSEPRFLA